MRIKSTITATVGIAMLALTFKTPDGREAL